MKVNRLISALKRGLWLIDARYAAGYLPMVEKFLSGEKVAWDDDQDEPEEQKPVFYAISAKDGQMRQFDSLDMAEPGSIAVIPIQGPIMKESWCGSPGTQEMGAFAKQADRHSNIIATILHLDTGGGAVDGTFEFADILSNSQKPVVAWVDGMAASAGYALAVRAQHIMMSHATAEIGSIGTAIGPVMDYSKAREGMGAVQRYARATDSTQKNEDFIQFLKGNSQPLINNILDPTNQIFLNSVREHRAGKLNEGKPEKGTSAGEPLNGQMYLAERAIELGLADSIGTFDDAVALALQLAQTTKTQRSLNPNTNSMHKIKSTWTAILAFFGVAAPQGSEYVETQLSEEMLEKLNGELSRLQTENQALSQENQRIQSASDTAIAQLTTGLETVQKEADDWKAKAEAFGSQPGALPTAALKGKEVIESSGDTDFQKIIDNLPHNKAVDSLPLFN